MTATDPEQGSRVHDTREEGGTWRVVSIKEEGIGLSGPLPCRGMKYVDPAEFAEFWETVSK